MTILIVLVLVSYFSLTLGQNCVCGIESRARRIIGGTEVPQAKYPWMAFLQVNTTTFGNFGCGGAIINNLFILTAAHCLDNVTEMKVGVGSIYDNTQNVMLPVEPFLQHPDYQRRGARNDIALVKLTTPLRWSKSIRPICLPSADMDTSGNLTVAGWGVKDMDTGEFSHTLLSTVVEEYSFDECKLRWGHINSTTQFCAALIGKDSCEGDSGGPLVKRFNGRSYNVGVVSFGAQECGTERSAVYTKVTHFLDWIRQNTMEGNYCTV